jgi:hypothetical protein
MVLWADQNNSNDHKDHNVLLVEIVVVQLKAAVALAMAMAEEAEAAAILEDQKIVAIQKAVVAMAEDNKNEEVIYFPILFVV